MRLTTILQLVPFMFVIVQLFHPGGVVQCFYCSATEANGMCRGHSYDAYGPCNGFCLKIALHTDRDGVDGINAVDDIIGELVANSIENDNIIVPAAAASSASATSIKTISSTAKNKTIKFNNSTRVLSTTNSTTSRPSTTTSTTLVMEHMMEWLNDHSSSEQVGSTTAKTLFKNTQAASNSLAPATEDEDNESDAVHVDRDGGSFVLDAGQQRAQFRRFSQFIHNELNDRISLSYVCGCDNTDYCNSAKASVLFSGRLSLVFLLLAICYSKVP